MYRVTSTYVRYIVLNLKASYSAIRILEPHQKLVFPAQMVV